MRAAHFVSPFFAIVPRQHFEIAEGVIVRRPLKLSAINEIHLAGDAIKETMRDVIARPVEQPCGAGKAAETEKQSQLHVCGPERTKIDNCESQKSGRPKQD